jgi:hypothetical protein
MPKRKYGVGRVEQREQNRFRLRYSISGKRYTKTVVATGRPRQILYRSRPSERAVERTKHDKTIAWRRRH